MLSPSLLPDSLQSYGLYPARPLCPWGLSRQEYWSGLPCPPPEDPPNPGMEPRFPTLQADSLPSEPPGEPKLMYRFSSVQSLSCVQLFVTPWTVAHQAPLSMGALQARILEWVAILFSRGSSQPRDQNCICCIAGGFFTAQPPGKPQEAKSD